MVNKEWFKQLEEDELWTRNYLQELIDKYCSDYYNVVEDITPENVHQFLKATLSIYQRYLITRDDLIDLGEALRLYFYQGYKDEFSNSFYPRYSENDKRTLSMNVIDLIESYSEIVLPEDVEYLNNYLNTPKEYISNSHIKINNYFNAANKKIKGWKLIASFKAIQQQRAEAEAKGEPEPLEPDKKLMFEILTGNKVPVTISTDRYTQNITSSLCPEQDYCVTIRYNGSSGEEELDIHKK